tara:strand:- start:22890 stop:24197 length:1308 start_codon:yes stop_codon:yes gene_type:complete
MTNRYENYKPSDIDFISDIPSHWKVYKVNELFSLISSGTTPKSNEDKYYSKVGFNWIASGDLNNGYVKNTKKKITQFALNDCNLKFYKKNSIIIAMYGATIGKMGIVDFDNATTNQACCVLDKAKENYKYLFYMFLNHKNIFILKALNGIQPNISQDLIKNERFYIPTKKEQEAIANYLDKKTQEIDDSVETLKKQKDLLIEERKAIIHKAVTKGLDDTVPMKDSNIEWLGDIPSHWKVKHLKNLINYKTGNTPDSKKESFYGNENDFKWANISDLNKKYLYDTKKYLTIYGIKEKNMKVVKENSLLFSFKLSVGSCSFNKVPLYTNEAIAAFENNKNINLNWLYYFMSYFFINNAKENIYGAKILNRELIENGYILKIPTEEQESISNYLDKKTSRIDEALNELEKQIDLLEEYKKVLINDVVTGKKRVYDGEI